jgi:hypothetical protein
MLWEKVVKQEVEWQVSRIQMAGRYLTVLKWQAGTLEIQPPTFESENTWHACYWLLAGISIQLLSLFSPS